MKEFYEITRVVKTYITADNEDEALEKFEDEDFIFQGWEDNKVIAWQPLPQPYKEGSE